MPALTELQPGKRQFRVSLQRCLTVANFDDQQTIIGEIVCGIRRILWAISSHPFRLPAQGRLVAIFIRHVRHVLGIHIGWVAENTS